MKMSWHWIQRPHPALVSFVSPLPSSLADSRDTICGSSHHLSNKMKGIASTSQQCLSTIWESTPQGSAHSRYDKHGRSSLCELNSSQNGPLSSSVQLYQFKAQVFSCKANWEFFFLYTKKMRSHHPSHSLLHSRGFLIALHCPWHVHW